jgi:hypothetical protein
MQSMAKDIVVVFISLAIMTLGTIIFLFSKKMMEWWQTKGQSFSKVDYKTKEQMLDEYHNSPKFRFWDAPFLFFARIMGLLFVFGGLYMLIVFIMNI